VTSAAEFVRHTAWGMDNYTLLLNCDSLYLDACALVKIEFEEGLTSNLARFLTFATQMKRRQMGSGPLLAIKDRSGNQAARNYRRGMWVGLSVCTRPRHFHVSTIVETSKRALF
jgi:hypothetical protein